MKEPESYKKIKLLGKGSFGKAFLVQCLSDQSYAVIKKIDIKKMSEEEKKATYREAKFLEMINHPNIIRFKEAYKTQAGQLCIVMDYADSGDIANQISEHKPDKWIAEEQIIDYFTQTTLALKHVHDKKILHRDLKSNNLFLTKEGIVKMGDFGISKMLGESKDMAVTVVGTPYYISPEIV